MMSRGHGATVLLAGMAATLGFAPFFLWPVGVASIAYLWWLVREAASPRQAALAALVWGMGHQLTALYWLPRAFYLDADRSVMAAIAGGIPALVVIALYGALAVVLVAWSARSVPVSARPGVFVVGWVALEVIKSLHPMGFPWLPVGAMWGGSLPLLQTASVVGVHGISVLLVTLAVLVTSWQPWRWRVVAAMVLVAYAGGVMRLQDAPADDEDGATIRLVQPNIQSAHKWNPELRMQYLRETLATAYAPGSQRAEAIFMPEAAVAFYLQEEPSIRQLSASGLYGQQALVTGSVRRAGEGSAMQFFNGLTVLYPDATLGDWYDKQLLVPFGEYIPLRSVLDALPLPAPIRVLSQSRLDFTHGTVSPLLTTPVGHALGLICYEGIFPYHVLRHARGADYLLNITNDNWFTGTTALAQHATLERLRAVETGLPLVRVANTGLTMLVDGYGRIRHQLPPNQAGYLDVPLPPSQVPTFLARWMHAL